ncbi:hypothetical protein AAFN86_11640 [Roseomonas sp. CAU 1739]|uniref:hypothetical protein n=1 Tax=Roseomonas sp. CAU 1739 TaxID=3140364 RepID=UPI00325BB49C
MSPFAGFAAGVALMLVADGAFCLILPRLICEAYKRRALAGDTATKARGFWLLGAGTLGLLVVAFL